MANVTVAQSSIGTSRGINLDWQNSAPITAAVTGSSSGTFTYSIQYCLDDLVQTPAANVTWVSDPNASNLTANSSVAFLYQQPLAGIRLNVTALSSAVVVLKCNQGAWL